jgi:hypothetical protein
MSEEMFPMLDGPPITMKEARRINSLYQALFTGQSLERIRERGGFGYREIPHFEKAYKKQFGEAAFQKISAE